MRPVTYNRLKNIALFYLERYDASSIKLAAVLHRRIQKMKQKMDIPSEANKWIAQVVDECVRLGYINDKRYAENQARTLSQQGKSARFITQKLTLAGVDSDIIYSVLNNQDDLTRAQNFVRKKHLGSDYQKDLAKLARAGFSYDTAQQALKGDTNV